MPLPRLISRLLWSEAIRDWVNWTTIGWIVAFAITTFQSYHVPAVTLSDFVDPINLVLLLAGVFTDVFAGFVIPYRYVKTLYSVALL